MRRLLVATLIAGSATFVGVAPAHAVTPPTIDTIDWTTTPGHVTGTVASDAAWVHVAVGVNGSWPGDKGFFPVDPGSHQATFDLETWGMRSSGGPLAEVGVTPCTSNTFDTCTVEGGQPLTVSAPFQPTDIRPGITFSPIDGTVGAGEQLTATVSDRQGGGLLKAWWTSEEDGDTTATQVLDRDGTTQLTVGEGAGVVRVVRCSGVESNVSQFFCDNFEPPLEHRVETRRKDIVSASVAGPATATHPSIDVTVQSTFGDSAITVDWRLTNPWGGALPDAPSGKASGTTAADGTFNFSIDASGLPTDAYGVTGTVDVHNPTWGTFTTTLPAEGPSVDVDTDAPAVTSMTASRPYVRPESPAADTVDINALGPNADSQDDVVVLDPSGQPIRVLETTVDHGAGWHATFDGRRDDGTPLPSGLYTIIVRDPAGNVGGTSVTVRVQRLVTRTTRTTLTARGSKVDQYVGRCSTLRTPASRGWTGSLGYYANTRCRSTRWADSAVATQHRAVMPAAASYVDVQVAVYSGASRGYGRSQAVMLYDNPTETAAVGQRTLGAALATRAAPRVAAAKVLRTVSGRRYLYWEVATAYAQRYDVKSFTVTVRYRIWA